MSRILVVEDEVLIGMMMADWLQELGHEVHGPAASEAAAIAVLDSAEVEAAFVDLHLAEGDGHAVARALRARGVPFAIMSGSDALGMPEAFGDCAILPKPFTFEKVEALLGAWFRSPADPRPEGSG